jgi:hypothetical protein
LRIERGFMRQNKLTVIIPNRAGAEGDLEAMLKQTGDDVARDTTLPFPRSPSTHFARFVIFRREARLLFSSCYSGGLAEYARELVTVMGAGLDQVFRHCESYEPGSWLSAAKATRFCEEHDQGYNFFVVAFPGTPVSEILAATRLRAILSDLLDVEAVRTVIAGLYPRGLQIPPPRYKESKPNTALVNFIDSLLVKPMPKQTNTILKTRKEVSAVEDRIVQNELTCFSTNKPGFQRLLLRAVFLGARLRSLLGSSIGGLPMIHFAQWSIIDRGEHLLFESNYDGTWEKYIDDFIDNSFLGMNAIWGRSPDYPPGGARNTEAFKKGIRDFQYPAQVFYSAYRDSTVQNIYDSLALHKAVTAGARSLSFRRFVSGSHTQLVIQ